MRKQYISKDSLIEHRAGKRNWLLGLVLLTGLVLTGCAKADDVVDVGAEVAEEATAGAAAGGAASAESESGEPLNLFIEPFVSSEFCLGEKIPVTVHILNFDAVKNGSAKQAENIIIEELGTPVSTMIWEVAVGTSGGDPVSTPPKDTFNATFQFGGDVAPGKVQVTASAKWIVEGGVSEDGILVASGEAEPVEIEIEKCPVDISIQYEGEFVDDIWTRTEVATMEKVRLTAQQDGPYKGSGSLVIEVFQAGNPGGGECNNADAPWRGQSVVDISGGFDDEGEELQLDFDFQPTMGTGAVMTCSAAGYSVPTAAADSEMNPGLWGLTELAFAPDGDTQNVPVETGLSAASGGGTVTIIVEPVKEEISAVPADRSAGWRWLLSLLGLIS